MRNLVYVHLLFILSSSCAILQKSELADQTLFTINSDTTTADQFLYVYEKNNFNNDSIYTERDVDTYFDLFLNFKLKVKAAKSEGMDSARTFLEEYNGYKNQLIKPYRIETQAQEKLVEEAYERMNYEVDASHILVVIKPDALPEDTAKAYQKIMEAREKAIAGHSFEELAVEYSEDPSAKTNKGRLGYFTAFQMVFAFEDAAYKTPADAISPIIRSQFGYHILKVHDRRPSSGKVKVSHIMLRVDDGNDDTTSIRKKIFEIHDQLLRGADWNTLCQKYSDDQRTKDSGGTLPFIGLKQVNDPAFEAIAFSLKTPGEISQPVRSGFGWHIIKLEERKGLEPFDEIKADLEQKVSKDDRSQLSKQAVISKLKTQSGYKENKEAREHLILLADSSLLAGSWDIPQTKAYSEELFFSINGVECPTASVIENVKKDQKKRTGIDPKKYMNELIDGFIEKTLLDNEEKQLVLNNRDFKMLLNEYYEGILLFDIMNENVWGKAVTDTVGLNQYFQHHQNDYYWKKRADAVIVSTEDAALLTNIKKIINDESIKLLEIVLDPERDNKVLNNKDLDALFHLYRKYDNSTVVIYSNENASRTDIFKDIMRYINDLGMKEHTILKPALTDYEHKVVMELNTKSKKSLEYQYNKESALTLQVTEGLFEKGDNSIMDSLNWKIGIQEFTEDKNHFLVNINEILDPQPKTLNEVKGTVISDYQNDLEKTWLEALKDKNDIVINYSTLDKIKKAYRKKLITVN